MLSVEEALRRHNLSEEEYHAWYRAAPCRPLEAFADAQTHILPPRRRDTIAANVRTKPPTRDSLALDYQWTNEQIKLLTDIRFRLLVLVPPLVAVGVTLLSNPTFGGGASPLAMIGVGLLGLSITFGVVLYDLRNSQLYDALINRPC
jgi:hypothetical protein